MNLLKGMTCTLHFIERCRERGIVESDPVEVSARISRAIRSDCWDDVQLVMTYEDASFYRFHVPEGRFYAIVPAGADYPVTVLTHEMMKAKKFQKKQRKRPRRAKFRPSGRRPDPLARKG